MQVHGACHCGKVTFTAEIDPAKVMICNCADCQTLSGAPLRAIGQAPIASLNSSGKPRATSRPPSPATSVLRCSAPSAQLPCTPRRLTTRLLSLWAASQNALNSSLGCSFGNSRPHLGSRNSAPFPVYKRNCRRSDA